MLRKLRPMLLLAILFIILGTLLLMVDAYFLEANTIETTREIIVVSVVFFSFTFIELAIADLLAQKDTSFYIGANLGFSLLRLVVTLGLLFVFRQYATADFIPAFLNILVFYFATLLFSTWRRQKMNRQTDISNETNRQI